MEVEPRSRAMRRAKDDARRKRRTTVIASPQMPVQSWTGCAGSTAASWRTGTPRGTSPLTESFDGTVALLSIVQSQFHRPAGFRLALGDLRGIGVRARPYPTIPKRGIRDCA